MDHAFILQDAVLDINSKTTDHETPLFKCANYGNVGSSFMRKIQRQIRNDLTIQGLLRLGANPDLAKKNGDTPLHVAIRSMWVGATELLLNAGAKTNLVNDKGKIDKTADLIAREHGHPEIEKLLHDKMDEK